MLRESVRLDVVVLRDPSHHRESLVGIEPEPFDQAAGRLAITVRDSRARCSCSSFDVAAITTDVWAANTSPSNMSSLSNAPSPAAYRLSAPMAS
jgi:hypothetical protein